MLSQYAAAAGNHCHDVANAAVTDDCADCNIFPRSIRKRNIRHANQSPRGSTGLPGFADRNACTVRCVV